MSRQLITFQLDNQILAVDIMAIREIRAWSPTIPLPGVPAHVLGVISLRGVALPVLDLRQRLGWGETETTARHVIIVVQVAEQLLGLVVDAVNDIVTVSLNDLQAIPDLEDRFAAHLLDGLVAVDDRMITVLALDNLLEQPVALPEAA